MSAEHLLIAIGLLDDDLIQEAERVRRPNYGKWIAWAASLALVIALGYGITHPGAGGGTGGASGNAGNGMQSADGEMLPSEEYSGSGADTPCPESPDLPNDGAEDMEPAIMLDGILYYSTGLTVEEEINEADIQAVTSYTNAVPEMDGQTNFSQDLSAKYARLPEGLAVWMDGTWILFTAPEP